jgi:hypothetical protein
VSSYSFLIGRPDKRPVFSHRDNSHEIAYACDWVPIGWLALFEAKDVQVVDEPPESDTYDPDTSSRCPTLIRKRDAALETLRRRRERLSKVLPPHLQPQLHGLEAAIAASTMPYIQVVLSEVDMFMYRGAEKVLRDLVATMDGDNVKQWRNMLSHVDTEMGKDLSAVEFSQMTGVAAVVGYLPEKYAVSLGATKKTVAKAIPIVKAKIVKQPWWKVWLFGAKSARAS